MRLRDGTVLLLLSVGATSCSDAVAPAVEAGSPIRTDAPTYFARHVGGEGEHARFRFEVVATYVNDSERPVFIGRCDPSSETPIYGVALVEGRDSDSAYDAFWGCVGHDAQFRVDANESRVDTLLIEGPNQWDRHGMHYGQLEGRFRISYDIRFCPGEDCQDAVPEADRLSNDFRVVLDR